MMAEDEMTRIHEIRGKLLATWLDDVRAVLDTWATYDISLDDFRETVVVKGVDYARAHGGVAWIVDSSTAVGSFSDEIQRFILTDVYPAFARVGIRHFITITSKVSLATRRTVSRYAANTKVYGIQLVEAENVEAAKEWLRRNASRAA
jgi:hypothetical protein